MKEKFKKVNGGIIITRGAKEIFVPEMFLKSNGKIKAQGKKYIEQQMNKKKVG
jgi:hypothetical protein